MELPDHIVYVYERISAVDLQSAGGVLSAEEQAYLENVTHEARRRSFTAGRLVARRLAGSKMNCKPEAVPLAVAVDGSLHLPGTDYNLSLAHSPTGVCAVMAASSAVGIDLESIRPRHPDLYRYILHPEEYRLLEELDLDRDSILILCWSLKEAVLKAMRTGFRCSPKKLRLEVDLDRNEAAIVINGGSRWECRFEIRDDNYLAIAYPA